MAATQDPFGGPDIFVNNAGIQHVAPVYEFPTDKWDQIIAVNLSSRMAPKPHRRPAHRHDEDAGRPGILRRSLQRVRTCPTIAGEI